MDRPVDSMFQRVRTAKRFLGAALALLIGGGLLAYANAWLRPSISRSRVRTARVDRGPVEAAITASGTVEPEFEQVLSSPIDSRVLRILKRPGDLLARGDAILMLDTAQPVLDLDKIGQDLALKRNQQARARIDLDKTLDSVQSQWEIKNLELQGLSAKVVQNRRLFEKGVLSEEDFRRAERAEATAKIELKQLEDARRNAQQSTEAQLEGLTLEIQTLEKERGEAERQLNLATTKADRDGVLTWIVTEEGATVQKGAVLARIADLERYRVKATVSDIHAKQLAAGMPVRVKINDDYLTGTVSNVLPTVENGIITLTASLDQASSPLLRPNLRVDVLVVMERKESVLRIARGPATGGEGVRDLFVVRGETAVKVPVRLGVANFDACEVVDGLLEGDEVVVSDMADYAHLKEIILS
jgi:HlyD family secretion protein